MNILKSMWKDNKTETASMILLTIIAIFLNVPLAIYATFMSFRGAVEVVTLWKKIVGAYKK